MVGAAMRIPIYQIDAFSSHTFRGNPAAVCPLESWPDTNLLQSIAGENNLPETAFFVREEGGYRLRWFTTKMEVDLCGHATLASAYVIFQFLEKTRKSVSFETLSGRLIVQREDPYLAMLFPGRPASACPRPEGLAAGLGFEPVEVLRSRDYMAVYRSEKEILELKPEMSILERLDCLGVIVTAPGESSDFVSRFFAPGAGIPEDPVTGSAHCTLIPYWAQKLKKKKMVARQLSERGGELVCEDLGAQVKISGQAAIYLQGFITV